MIYWRRPWKSVTYHWILKMTQWKYLVKSFHSLQLLMDSILYTSQNHNISVVIGYRKNEQVTLKVINRKSNKEMAIKLHRQFTDPQTLKLASTFDNYQCICWLTCFQKSWYLPRQSFSATILKSVIKNCSKYFDLEFLIKCGRFPGVH